MIRIFSCDKKKLQEINFKEIEPKSKKIYWIDLENFDYDEVNYIKEIFNIHPTTEEDILSNQTRVKYEEFEENTFIVFKGIKKIKSLGIDLCTISFLLGENYFITSHFEKNENTYYLIENSKKLESLMRKGKDYLLHYFLDKEMDKCIQIKNNISEDFKKLEKSFIQNPKKEVLEELFEKELLILEIRQLMESLTDLCLCLIKPTDNYISNELLPYFRDIYDHSFKTTESLKSILGRINGMRNAYQSIISNKLNETMKFLTWIMAIMMPMTIVTGFYGMNVKLPFQENAFVWVGILVLIAGISILMYFLFQKLKIK